MCIVYIITRHYAHKIPCLRSPLKIGSSNSPISFLFRPTLPNQSGVLTPEIKSPDIFEILHCCMWVLEHSNNESSFIVGGVFMFCLHPSTPFLLIFIIPPAAPLLHLRLALAMGQIEEFITSLGPMLHRRMEGYRTKHSSKLFLEKTEYS